MMKPTKKPTFGKLLSTIGLLFLFQNGVIQAQNLIVDGSFENNLNCPQNISNLGKDLAQAIIPTNGTTDYFNRCGNAGMRVPKNFKGYQEPSDGNAYIGMYLYAPNDYREYVQFPLNQTLKKGQVYEIKMDFSLSESSDYGVEEPSLLLTNAPLYANTSKNLTFQRLVRQKGINFHTLKMTKERSMVDKESWITISGVFEAKGFENYVTIGNLLDNKDTKRIIASGNIRNTYAYYYLDNVRMREVIDPGYETDKIYVLDNIVFKYDSYELPNKAQKNLKEIYDYLEKNPKLSINISGHTDDLGTENYNKRLSLQRAKSVAMYLIGLGLQENRISWEGLGNKKPLFKVFNEAARKANRRVEFVMSELVDN